MKLEQCIERYVEDKRAAGFNFSKGQQSLSAFCKHIGDVPLRELRPQQIEAFLDGSRSSDLAWVRRYNLLRSFFLFWRARDLMKSLPLPPPRRPVKRSFVPYIYSQAEVRLLLSTTRASQAYPTSGVDARTLRAFLLFLYGTGVLIGEARRIRREDIDFKRNLVTLRNSRLQPARTIPFGADLYKVLKGHCDSCRRKHHGPGTHLFVDKHGLPLKESTLNHTFQKLRRRTGITRRDGITQPPRMHDLRYTFAVHRLTAWHKRGADLNRMIPALSVYMGYVRLGASARFLRLTSERFRPQLNELSPRKGIRHWRDDPALMQFLSTL